MRTATATAAAEQYYHGDQGNGGQRRTPEVNADKAVANRVGANKNIARPGVFLLCKSCRMQHCY